MFVANQRRRKWGDSRKGALIVIRLWWSGMKMGSRNQYDWCHLAGLTKDAIQLDMSSLWGR